MLSCQCFGVTHPKEKLTSPPRGRAYRCCVTQIDKEGVRGVGKKTVCKEEPVFGVVFHITEVLLHPRCDTHTGCGIYSSDDTVTMLAATYDLIKQSPLSPSRTLSPLSQVLYVIFLVMEYALSMHGLVA